MKFTTLALPRHLLFLLLAVALLPHNGHGAETPTNAWVRSIGIGATLTRGNSSTILTSGRFAAERVGGDVETRLGVEINYGEADLIQTNGTSTTDNNVNNIKAAAEVRKTLSARTYAYAKGEAITDRIGGIDYRLVIGPGLGCYLLKDKDQSLSTDLGVSYIHQEPSKDLENIAAFRLSERYDLKVSPTSKLWQTVEYLPAVKEYDKFLMNAELGIEAAMNASLSLRVNLQDKYNSEAPEGKKKNDLIMIAGIACKF